MSDLPKNWLEESIRNLNDDRKTWPEWMKRGVQEATDHAEERLRKYGVPPESSAHVNGKTGME